MHMPDIKYQNATLIATRRRPRVNLKRRIAGIERDNRRLERDNRRLKSDSRSLLAEGADPVIRQLLDRLFEFEPFSDLCMIGTNGCQTHPGVGEDCPVAWIKSWLYTGKPIPSHAAGIGLMVADSPDAATLMADALDYWREGHEPAAAGAEGIMLHRVRLARELAHSLRGNL